MDPRSRARSFLEAGYSSHSCRRVICSCVCAGYLSSVEAGYCNSLHVPRGTRANAWGLTSRALQPKGNPQPQVDLETPRGDRMHRWAAVLTGQTRRSPNRRPVSANPRSLAPPPRAHPRVGPAALTPGVKSFGPSHSPNPHLQPPALGCPDRLRRRLALCACLLVAYLLRQHELGVSAPLPPCG